MALVRRRLRKKQPVLTRMSAAKPVTCRVTDKYATQQARPRRPRWRKLALNNGFIQRPEPGGSKVVAVVPRSGSGNNNAQAFGRIKLQLPTQQASHRAMHCPFKLGGGCVGHVVLANVAVGGNAVGRRPRWRKFVPNIEFTQRPGPGGSKVVGVVPRSIPGSGNAKAFRSINVQWPFATLLMAGFKKLEMRKYKLQSRLAPGEWLWLVETPGRYSFASTAASPGDCAIERRPLKASIIGMVRFDDCLPCNDLVHFAKLASLHCVRLDGPMRWDGRGSMRSWVVGSVLAVQRRVVVENRFPQNLFGFRLPTAQPDVRLSTGALPRV